MLIELLDIPFIPKHSGLDRSLASETGKLHLSDVIKFILQHMGKGYADNDKSWDLDLAAELGFIWEDVLGNTLADRALFQHIRPGEIECDGIVGSPDGIGEDPKREFAFADHEYKCTWRSTNKTPDVVDYWMMQFKGYCYMMTTPCCIVWALHINGDWKFNNKKPVMLPYRIVFTENELWENWQMVLNNSKYMKEKGIWKA